MDEDYSQYGPLYCDLSSGRWTCPKERPPTRCDPVAKLSGAGWIVEILPFLEEQAQYDQFKKFLDSPFCGNYRSPNGLWGLGTEDAQLRLALARPTQGADLPVGAQSQDQRKANSLIRALPQDGSSSADTCGAHQLQRQWGRCVLGRARHSAI